ncbi:MAG: Na+/H+ antiporter subunit E, partial [Brevibacterium sp.]|nr:Na+/H+ antiporter subunit E [Brevibacterium sp.]
MRRLINAVSYVCFIEWAIIVGSLTVASRLFRAHRQYANPMIVEVPLRCVTDLEVTLFASSITITPGTLVAAIASGPSSQPPVLFVHALFEDSEESALE